MIRSEPERSLEEAALFNPAFTSLLLRRVIEGYGEAQGEPMPLVLAYVAAPLVLVGRFRNSLPVATTTKFINWLESHPANQALFPEHAKALAPVTRDAISFGSSFGVLAFYPPAHLNPGERKIKKSVVNDPPLLKLCQQRASFLGRWLPSAGSTTTVMALLGVRP